MRIGIVGAGMIGSTVAKLWVDAGHEVRLASRHPNELKPLIERLGTRASAGTPEEAAQFGDVVMLTVPLTAIPELAQDLAPLLGGKVVLDTGNAYAQRDRDIARDATLNPEGSAGWAAAQFPKARWVKAFNPYDLYSKSRTRPDVEALRPYYEDLIAEYFPSQLRW